MLVKGDYASGLEWTKELGLSRFVPNYSTDLGALFHMDSLDLLKTLPGDCLDLVMTSPPFALTRQKEYGNEPIERYLEWFMPFCLEIKRVLKPKGSFILDIGGSWIPGAPVRSVYHFDLAVRLAKEFFLAQEFYHFNPARLPTPAEWVTIQRIRVKDAVNMVWWFCKTEYPTASNRNVLQPYSDSMKSLLKNGYKAKKRPSGHDISEKFSVDNGGSIPSNVIQIANTESNSPYLRACRHKGIKPHPARYPEGLVKFFLDFLTNDNALVYDPFAGSNVTGAVCQANGRRWLASEENAVYVEGSMLRFDVEAQLVAEKERRRAATQG